MKRIYYFISILLQIFTTIACSNKFDEDRIDIPDEKIDSVAYSNLVVVLDSLAESFKGLLNEQEVISAFQQVKGVKSVDLNTDGVVWVTSNNGEQWFYAPKGTLWPEYDVTEETINSIVEEFEQSIKDLQLDSLLTIGDWNEESQDVNYNDFIDYDGNGEEEDGGDDIGTKSTSITSAMPSSERYLKPEFKILFVHNAPDMKDRHIFKKLLTSLSRGFPGVSFKECYADSSGILAVNPDTFKTFDQYDLVILANHGCHSIKKTGNISSIVDEYGLTINRTERWETYLNQHKNDNAPNIYGFIGDTGKGIFLRQGTFDELLPDMSNTMLCSVTCYGELTGFYHSLMSKNCPVYWGSSSTVTMPIFPELIGSFLRDFFLGASAVSAWNKDFEYTGVPISYNNKPGSEYGSINFKVNMTGNAISNNTMICKPFINAYPYSKGTVDINDPKVCFRLLVPSHLVSTLISNNPLKNKIGYELKDLTTGTKVNRKLYFSNTNIVSCQSIGNADAVKAEFSLSLLPYLKKGHRYELKSYLMFNNGKQVINSPYVNQFDVVDNLNYFEMTFNIPKNENNCYLTVGDDFLDENNGKDMRIKAVQIDDQRIIISGLNHIKIPPGKHIVKVYHTGKLLRFLPRGPYWSLSWVDSDDEKCAIRYIVSVNVPSSVKWLRGLYGSTLENITLHNGLLMIESGAFAGCKKLYDIKLPSTVESIGIDAFSGSGLLSLHIPNSAKHFSYVARDCKLLESLILPQTTTYFYAEEMIGCDKLQSLIILAPNPPGLNTINIEKMPRPTVFVPLEYTERYMDSIWGQYFTIKAI